VDLVFTVTTAGTVRDPVVEFSTSSLFDRAAIRAVLKFKYKPRVVDGQPVDVPNVKTRIRFQLEE
jgi:protein TonB